MATAQEAITAFSEATPEQHTIVTLLCLCVLRTHKDKGGSLDEILQTVRKAPTDDDTATSLVQSVKALATILWDEVDGLSGQD